MKNIKVAIIEDHHIFRKRLAELLSFYDEISLVVISPDAEHLLSYLESDGARPDVLLMDIELPGISGIEATFRIKERYPDMDVIMFTVFENDDRIFESIQVGATGYLLKDEPIEQVVQAIKEVHKGGSPITPSIARKVMSLLAGIPKSDAMPEQSKEGNAFVPFDLTPAEIRILEQVVSGKKNKEIADELFLSPWTIKTHIKNIYKKMQVNSRAAVVQLAMRRQMF